MLSILFVPKLFTFPNLSKLYPNFTLSKTHFGDPKIKGITSKTPSKHSFHFLICYPHNPKTYSKIPPRLVSNISKKCSNFFKNFFTATWPGFSQKKRSLHSAYSSTLLNGSPGPMQAHFPTTTYGGTHQWFASGI